MILQQIPRVVPAAPRVDLRSRRQRPIRRPTVLLVALHIEPRIVPAPLLPHVFQKLIRQSRPCIRSNLKR